jgi:membrane protein YqaA with SNARE-associated domain
MLIPVFSGAIFLGQAAPDPLTPWATGSAAAVLGCVVGWLLTRTIPQMQQNYQETLDRMAERHERWEQTRHADSMALNETLRNMSATCAKVHELERAEDG